MQSLYIGSYQLHSNSLDIGRAVTDAQGLEMPEIRTVALDRAGEHGGIVVNSLYGNRLITLRGRIWGGSLAQYEQRRREFIEAVTIELGEFSIATPKVLYITTTDGVQLQCNVFISDFKLAIKQPNVAEFQINLICPDMALESQSLQTVLVGRTGGGGAVYPLIYPAVYSAGATGASSLYNSGTVFALPTLVFSGVLTNPRFTNLTTGESFQLEMTINLGSIVEVNMKDKTVIQDGNINRIADMSSDSSWLKIEKGINNVQLTTLSSADTGNVVVKFSDSYLGV